MACTPGSTYQVPPGPTLLAPLPSVSATDNPPLGALPAPVPSEIQPALALHFPKPRERRWNGGMRLLVVERHDSPLAELRLIVDGAGGLADRPGVAQLCAELIRDGAAADTPSSMAFARSAHALGADIETQVDAQATSFRMLIEGNQIAEGLEVFGNMLARQRLSGRHFPATRKRMMREASAWARGDHPSLALELIGRLIRGAGLPTSRKAGRGTLSELSRIRLEHCNNYYARRIVAAKSTLLIVGPTSLDAAHAAATKALSRWRSVAAKQTAPAQVLPDSSFPRRVFVIDRPKSPRAWIYAALTLPATTLTTLPAADLLQEILSRRVAQIRQQPDGHITSVLLGDRGGHGTIVLGLDVEAERGGVATKELLESSSSLDLNLSDVHIRPLQAALLANLRTDLDRNPSIANRIEEASSLGLGSGYFTSYPKRLKAVSARVIEQLAAVMSSPRAIVVIGDKELLGPPLSKLGEVQVVNPLRGFAIQGRFRPESRPGETSP